MQKLLSELQQLCADRPYELLDAHEEGEKIVEYTGTYIPEELIYAARCKGYPMWRGGEPEPPDAVLDETVRFLNAYARTSYGLLKLGLDPVSSEADLYAFSIPEAHSARIAELFEYRDFPVMKMGVPACWKDPIDLEYYTKKVKEFIARLEIISGNPVNDAWMKEGIKKYNEIRYLLRAINELRKQDPTPISGSEFNQLVHCSMLVDPEVAIEYLTRALDICRKDQGEPTNKPRIIFFGHVIAHGDYVVLRAFEKAGADVVHEIMDDGRFFYDVDVDETDDPLTAIIKNRYLNRLPNNNMQPSWDLRRDALIQAVKDYKADGVVFYDMLYDEIYDMEYHCMADFCGKQGIPMLRISTSYEYTREAMGPLNTRIETFLAAIKGGKN